jgi:hypothetical protein
MFRFGIAACAAAAVVLAEGFTFTVGSPVASQDYQAKGAALCFVPKAARSLRSHKSAALPKGW